MHYRLSLFLAVLIIQPSLSYAQQADTLNRTDSKGMKQGYWIKKYPGGRIQYEGFFLNDKPAGTFKRYYEKGQIQSVQEFSSDGSWSDATFYHTNGFIASKGRYIGQSKEGKWQFFSEKTEGYLICEEDYLNNQKNGISLKYYPGKKLCEKLTYVKDIKSGDWTQYYPNGQICVSGFYSDGRLQGKFTVFFENGQPEYSGQYLDDARNGEWTRYDRDGNVKTKIKYMTGRAVNPELYIRETAYLDSLERNKGKIADPEKTGTIW
jgi:antitoxin component YwqK of YwqJK toxin-antitoxin module